MLHVGRCNNNRPNEGFWGIIKNEMNNLKKFHSFKEVKTSSRAISISIITKNYKKDSMIYDYFAQK